MAKNKKTLLLKGMHCASCVQMIEQSLRKVSGVTEANVNLATNKAVITYDTDKAEEEDLIKAVTDTGYEAMPEGHEGMTANEHAEHLKMQNEGELVSLRRRVIIALTLGALVIWVASPA